MAQESQDIGEEAARELVESLMQVHQLLMDDARKALDAGFSPHEWVARIRLLLAYSLPPEHAEHTQDAAGNWHHRIKEG